MVFPSPSSLGIRPSRRQDRGYGLDRDKCPAGGSVPLIRGAAKGAYQLPQVAVEVSHRAKVLPAPLECSIVRVPVSGLTAARADATSWSPPAVVLPWRTPQTCPARRG